MDLFDLMCFGVMLANIFLGFSGQANRFGAGMGWAIACAWCYLYFRSKGDK